MAASSLVVLGRIIKPHGVKGEIRVDYYAESPDLLAKPLMLRAGRFAPRPVHIREWHLWKDQLILSIEGCTDRSQAEQMRGQELLIDASFLPKTESDEPYLRDLIGLSVHLTSGEYIGDIEDIIFPAGQEIWTIRTPESQGGQEILFPAVPEFVQDIDLSAETATISPPEGLLELYQNSTLQNEPDDGQEEIQESSGKTADTSAGSRRE
jgi:16S rRNA processing protein RimM